LLTYQTSRDWGIEKSHSFEKLQNRGEDDGSVRGLFNGKKETGNKKWTEDIPLHAISGGRVTYL
jgi:hypothetical protein